MLSPHQSPLHPTFTEIRIFERRERAQIVSTKAASDPDTGEHASDWVKYCVSNHLI